ncbi:MAG TPA: fibronectin type III domain-containing protein [Thermoleophilaceae bacterium]
MLVVPQLSPAQLPAVPGTPGTDVNKPPARDDQPVILRGSQFPSWSAPANQRVQPPLIDLTTCRTFDEKCNHNEYAEAPGGAPNDTFPVSNATGLATPVDDLLAYRWDDKAKNWKQVPFQVDEVFTRYLDNAASGFSVYSGQDKHDTYAYDREGFRYWKSADDDPCRAVPGDPGAAAAPDPVTGLDDNDEMVFMDSDAGPQAPLGVQLPKGISDARAVQVQDPLEPGSPSGYVYVMKTTGEKGAPKPAFDAKNGYVSYKRDANADIFERSVSSYSGYGNARKGVYCDEKGNVVKDPKTGKPLIDKRRPRDYATVKTGRYKFRYDGRWLMTAVNIAAQDDGNVFGPDLVDRWKARAFAQDPGSETPCCGFEEEDTNWGGSSTLLGERVGPVRAIRETWGADSGTNVTRRETFYRNEMRMKSSLRVHIIPPLDGIYAQWDMAGGYMKKFFNPQHTEGLDIDGRNDEAFGNLDEPCNDNYQKNDTSAIDQGYRSFYGATPACDMSEFHQSVDIFDPTVSRANVALEWAQATGPSGTIIDRYLTEVKDITPGGGAQFLAATPYYRDDSCFDDGTGTDPGPKLHLRSGDEPRTAADGTPRRCWHPENGLPAASDHWFQGSIATHGVHLLFLVDSDNARQTQPISEIVSENRMVMLPGQHGAEAGQYYGGQPGQPGRFDQGPQGKPGGVKGLVDKRRPRVHLKIVRHRSHRRLHLRWAGIDEGGSGIKSYTLQVKRGRKWKGLKKNTKKLRYNFITAFDGGVYTFRIRAVDNAGNVGKWEKKRVRMLKFVGHKH